MTSFFLSLLFAFGVGLAFMGWTGMNIIPPEILTSVGGIIMFVIFWIGYRHHLNDRTLKERVAIGAVTAEWLTGKEVISICSIPHSSLLQYIIKGLPAYRSSTDISRPQSMQVPIPEGEVDFILGKDDSIDAKTIRELEAFWFLTADVKKHIKQLTSGCSRTAKNAVTYS